MLVMHQETLDFIADVRRRHPGFFWGGASVLDVGSRDINGSVREFFQDCQVVGIDCHPGLGVDVITLAHQFLPLEHGVFDVICSTNTLEHDPFASATMRAMYRLCRHEGLIFFSAAGPGNPEHGTTRAPRENGPYGPLPDHYENLTEEAVRLALDLEGGFSQSSIVTQSCLSKPGVDILFTGIVHKEAR